MKMYNYENSKRDDFTYSLNHLLPLDVLVF